MRKYLSTAVLLCFICLNTGCSGNNNSGTPVVSSSSNICDTGISSPTDAETKPAEDEDALLDYSLNLLTIEDNVVTDCASFATGIVIIPEGVTEIGIEAFDGCDSITELRLPSSMELISNYAFNDCSALHTIQLPEGLLAIYGSVFDGCSALREVALPDSLAVVSEYIFADIDVTFTFKGQSYKSADAQALCEAVRHYDENGFLVAEGRLFDVLPSVSGDVVVPDTVEKICSSAFYYLDIDTLTIPSSVEVIEDNAFVNCDMIQEITFEEGVTTLGDYIFTNCNFRNAVIHLPSTLTDISENSLNIIGDSVVYEYKGTEYRRYESYTTGDHPLYELLSILMPEYEDGLLVKDGVLTNCLYCRDSYFAPIEIPEGVSVIADEAFYGGVAVFFELQLPQTLTDIKTKAFSFTYITNLELPSNVKKIGEKAFYGCFNLETVKLNEGLEEIGCDAFAGCEDLTEINIPSTVKHIDETAFDGSDNVTVTFNGSSYTQANINELFTAING